MNKGAIADEVAFAPRQALRWLFSRVFSSSSSRSRRISDGINPAYLYFQLKYVAWPIPALRETSATGVRPRLA
jgi:hypothetical protein